MTSVPNAGPRSGPGPATDWPGPEEGPATPGSGCPPAGAGSGRSPGDHRLARVGGAVSGRHRLLGQRDRPAPCQRRVRPRPEPVGHQPSEPVVPQVLGQSPRAGGSAAPAVPGTVGAPPAWPARTAGQRAGPSGDARRGRTRRGRPRSANRGWSPLWPPSAVPISVKSSRLSSSRARVDSAVPYSPLCDSRSSNGRTSTSRGAASPTRTRMCSRSAQVRSTVTGLRRGCGPVAPTRASSVNASVSAVLVRVCSSGSRSVRQAASWGSSGSTIARSSGLRFSSSSRFGAYAASGSSRVGVPTPGCPGAGRAAVGPRGRQGPGWRPGARPAPAPDTAPRPGGPRRAASVWWRSGRRRGRGRRAGRRLVSGWRISRRVRATKPPARRAACSANSCVDDPVQPHVALGPAGFEPAPRPAAGWR